MPSAAALFLGEAAPATYDAAVLADSPLIYWKLNETSGSSYADSSPNGNTGTGTGTITQNQAAIFGSSASALFTTANSADVTDASDPYGTSYNGSLTFECFFKLTNLSQQNAIAGKGMSGADFSMYIRVDTDGTLRSGIVTTSGGDSQHDFASASGLVSSGVAYHIVVRWTSGVGLGVALNGSSAGSPLSFAHTGLRNSAVGPTVGRMITPIYCSGNIQNVAWYASALSDARIAAHYAARTL